MLICSMEMVLILCNMEVINLNTKKSVAAKVLIQKSKNLTLYTSFTQGGDTKTISVMICKCQHCMLKKKDNLTPNTISSVSDQSTARAGNKQKNDGACRKKGWIPPHRKWLKSYSTQLQKQNQVHCKGCGGESKLFLWQILSWYARSRHTITERKKI